jgi:hypothetical protein
MVNPLADQSEKFVRGFLCEDRQHNCGLRKLVARQRRLRYDERLLASEVHRTLGNS